MLGESVTSNIWSWLFSFDLCKRPGMHAVVPGIKSLAHKRGFIFQCGLQCPVKSCSSPGRVLWEHHSLLLSVNVKALRETEESFGVSSMSWQQCKLTRVRNCGVERSESTDLHWTCQSLCQHILCMFMNIFAQHAHMYKNRFHFIFLEWNIKW